MWRHDLVWMERDSRQWFLGHRYRWPSLQRVADHYSEAEGRTRLEGALYWVSTQVHHSLGSGRPLVHSGLSHLRVLLRRYSSWKQRYGPHRLQHVLRSPGHNKLHLLSPVLGARRNSFLYSNNDGDVRWDNLQWWAYRPFRDPTLREAEIKGSSYSLCLDHDCMAGPCDGSHLPCCVWGTASTSQGQEDPS